MENIYDKSYDSELMEKYRLWCVKAAGEADLAGELADMAGDNARIEDAFYRELSFGTAGLRGVIGAGTNRMNVFTVAAATQGLAQWLKKSCENPSAAVSYDSRIKSELFARVAAGVFAANGVRVYIWPRLMPVPALSFAVRHLGASAGVMITASHNPAGYNGYKVYGSDGCQITSETAEAVSDEISKLDVFDDVLKSDFESGLRSGMIEFIDDSVYNAFIDAVKSRSVLFGDDIDKTAGIVYSPLNGSGFEPVMRVLEESGYTNVTVVREQQEPDGNFPTCPVPNPEIKEAMKLGTEYAAGLGAGLVIATDPDCDRVGIAVRNASGGYDLLTGNQTGVLLLDYICSQRVRHGMMPDDPVMIKSIVTTDLAEKVAADYGVSTVNVLTGFKFIGERILEMEKQGRQDSFIFGYEESYGYLPGPYVRDKDGVGASLLICEMFCFYASQGISLTDRLSRIYDKYGYCLNRVHSYTFEGSAGFEKMNDIMSSLREAFGGCAGPAGGEDASCVLPGGRRVLRMIDYASGADGLPPADVIKLIVSDGCSAVVRPSGTEPKLKVYLTVSAGSREAAEEAEAELLAAVIQYF